MTIYVGEQLSNRESHTTNLNLGDAEVWGPDARCGSLEADAEVWRLDAEVWRLDAEVWAHYLRGLLCNGDF